MKSRMRTGALIAFAGVLFFACAPEKKIDQNAFGTQLPVVSDPVVSSEMRERKSLKSGHYNPRYIGKYSDTIRVWKPESHEFWRKCASYLADWREGKKYRYLDSGHCTIRLDTTLSLHHYDLHRNKATRGFPLFIFNTSPDTLQIANGEMMPIFLEALDAGLWKPVESEYMYMDDNRYNILLLPPGELAVVSIPILKGSFKTRLRIRYLDYTSHPFEGAIHKTQFTFNPDDEE